MYDSFSHSYSDAVYRERVMVIGPVPPPFGGVAVHVKRVMHKLRVQHNTVLHINSVYEYRYRWLWWYLLHVCWYIMRMRPTVLMYHTPYLSNSLSEMLLLWSMKKMYNYRMIVVEHDCRHLNSRGMLFKRWYGALLKSVEQLVLIGDKTYASYASQSMLVAKKCTLEGAFLPPNYEQEHAIIATYPASLHAFMSTHTPLMLVNAYELVLYNDKDLYGIDLTLAMFKNLYSEFPQSGLIIMLTGIGNKRYYQNLCKYIAHNGLEQRVHIIIGNYELWPLLKRVYVFLRPTLSDGSSVSVAEACALHVPVIASDACKRPEGVHVFATGDINAFTTMVREQLTQYATERIIKREHNENSNE